MRTSEWIQIGFAIVLAAAGWLQPLFARKPLPLRKRVNLTILALVPCCLIGLALLAARRLPPLPVSMVRDWLTVALFLVPYWQTGQFFQGANHKIEERLMFFDRLVMPKAALAQGTRRTAAGMLLEVAYLFCYPMVPLGLGTLYLLHQRDRVAGFWLLVLLATYACYVITPFVPAFPPRDLNRASPNAAVAGKTRRFNRFILQYGSIHAISFPSAHVAAAFAVALALLHGSLFVGLGFLAIAIAIALGAVAGRYHYALDVLMGAVTALIVYLACLPYL